MQKQLSENSEIITTDALNSECIDFDNKFLHVVITPSLDECSNASPIDVINFNRVMKFSAKNYKTALIQYMSRGNVELKRELFFIAMSAQKKGTSSKFPKEDD